MKIETKVHWTKLLNMLTFNLLYQRKFDKKWDTTLNSYLDQVETGELKAKLVRYTIEFSKENFYKEVWIENKFYCYGFLYVVKFNDNRSFSINRESQQFRPSCYTMIRLEKLVRKLGKEKEKGCSGRVREVV